MIEQLSNPYREAVTLVELDGLDSAGSRETFGALPIRNEVSSSTGAPPTQTSSSRNAVSFNSTVVEASRTILFASRHAIPATHPSIQ